MKQIKEITQDEYEKLCDKIIAKNMSAEDTLLALLELTTKCNVKIKYKIKKSKR